MVMNVRASDLARRALSRRLNICNSRGKARAQNGNDFTTRSLSTLLSSPTTRPAPLLLGTTTTEVGFIGGDTLDALVHGSSTRKLSTYPPGLRSYPDYTVFGETCLFSMKPIMPNFRVNQYREPTLQIESSSKRGRMLLEWVPREAVGTPARNRSAVRFALSPEECGFLLDQLPKNEEVVLVRRPPPSTPEDNNDENPDKVLHVSPGEGGTVAFKVDFEKDGVGGQVASGHYEPEIAGPFEVVVQAGEFQVIMSLIQNSIPYITGWHTMMDVALQNNLAYAFKGSTGSGGFSSSDQGNTPF